MSDTTAELELTPEESDWIDDFATWAEENAAAVYAGWSGLETPGQKILWLESYAPFGKFWDWLRGIGDWARRMALYLKMVDMLMTRIVNLLSGGAS